MDLSKNTVIGLGSLIIAGVVVGGSLLVIKPQLESASELQVSIADAKTEASNKQLKLDNLIVKQEEIVAIQSNVDNLIIAIPSENEVGTIGEAVANSINAIGGGVRLDSFSYGATEDFKAVDAPTVSLSEPVAPFTASGGGAGGQTAPPPTNEDGTDADSENPIATTPEAKASSFKRIPITLSISANSFTDMTNYIDTLSSQQRLLYIQTVVSNASSNNGGITATIYGYGFVSASENVQTYQNGGVPVNEAPAEETTETVDESETQE